MKFVIISLTVWSDRLKDAGRMGEITDRSQRSVLFLHLQHYSVTLHGHNS